MATASRLPSGPPRRGRAREPRKRRRPPDSPCAPGRIGRRRRGAARRTPASGVGGAGGVLSPGREFSRASLSLATGGFGQNDLWKYVSVWYLPRVTSNSRFRSHGGDPVAAELPTLGRRSPAPQSEPNRRYPRQRSAGSLRVCPVRARRPHGPPHGESRAASAGGSSGAGHSPEMGAMKLCPRCKREYDFPLEGVADPFHLFQKMAIW
ncbi:uncharacterized protein LOC118920112 [Manis pentadactyla]|uniref:uncharacterized protein LOC118920112 n=1 Tax=Manis pentadactyla TaxID=143292 RepID=UPI00255CC09D|nr:uncharacterized protein LOC118920112 [Manis pentadactyla]